MVVKFTYTDLMQATRLDKGVSCCKYIVLSVGCVSTLVATLQRLEDLRTTHVG